MFLRRTLAPALRSAFKANNFSVSNTLPQSLHDQSLPEIGDSSVPVLPPSEAISQVHTSSLPKPTPWSVRAVLDHPAFPAPAYEAGSASPIPFFHYVSRLKIEKREGWRRFGIMHSESIADHMYRMSLITILAPPALSKKLDIPRCTKMALIHDIAEGLVGDLTPMDRIPKPEKSRREAETMDWVSNGLLGKVHGGFAGQDIREIWQEYEDGKTDESKFVHDVDKIELLLQMVEYERAHKCSLDLSEFCWVAKRVKLLEMKDWAEEILKERERLWEEHKKVPRAPIKAEAIKEGREEYHGNGATS